MVIPARVLIGAVTAACAFALPGCGGSASAQRAPVLGVTERDFAITAPATIRAGDVTIRDTNRGPDTHELFLVRMPSHGRLPLRRDGLTVDEDAIRSATAGSLDGLAPGARGLLHLRLSPGRYLLLCNMAGHYLGGMHARLTVR